RRYPVCLQRGVGIFRRSVIFLVVFVIRLVSIMLATVASDMKFEERLLIGWFGPRGIVAASVAGIIGLRLELQFFS
ncbi:MAG: hypothetical protein O2962_03000, partial [Cyanobacteria bacterium]|nr:hypothetical protein [Cyanobacteriota bacterium]